LDARGSITHALLPQQFRNLTTKPGSRKELHARNEKIMDKSPNYFIETRLMRKKNYALPDYEKDRRRRRALRENRFAPCSALSKVYEEVA
jgi:hypothetical protein